MNNQDLAVLGFVMWTEYLANCSRDDLESFSPMAVNRSIGGIRNFTYVGKMPPEPTGPLTASLMGSAWASYIRAVIESCRNKDVREGLRNIVKADQQGNLYHNVQYLYEILRKADCRAFASHNPIVNRDALYKYADEHKEETYMSFFITLVNTSAEPTLRELQRDIKVLKSYSCTFALVSKCKQEISHIHGVLTFAWPISIPAVRAILSGAEVGKPFNQGVSNWSIEPVYCYQEYPITYILNQEYERLIDYRLEAGSTPHPVTVKNLDNGEAQGYVFKYTPWYYFSTRGLDIGRDVYDQYHFENKYRKYTAPLLESRLFFLGNCFQKAIELTQVFGVDAICEVNDPMTLTADSEPIKRQLPVLRILWEDHFTPAQVNDHLTSIKALFRYVIMKPILQCATLTTPS